MRRPRSATAGACARTVRIGPSVRLTLPRFAQAKSPSRPPPRRSHSMLATWLSVGLSNRPRGPGRAPRTANPPRGNVVSRVGFEPTTRGSKVPVGGVLRVAWSAFLSIPRGVVVHRYHRVGLRLPRFRGRLRIRQQAWSLDGTSFRIRRAIGNPGWSVGAVGCRRPRCSRTPPGGPRRAWPRRSDR